MIIGSFPFASTQDRILRMIRAASSAINGKLTYFLEKGQCENIEVKLIARKFMLLRAIAQDRSGAYILRTKILTQALIKEVENHPESDLTDASGDY